MVGLRYDLCCMCPLPGDVLMSQESLVQVVRLGPVNPLPNSDKLEITMVHGGYPCIVQKGKFKEGDLATYIPVDILVPTDRPEFAFLSKTKDKHRIKAMRLRGTFSMGLLVAAPPGYVEGQDASEFYGTEKYLPPSEQEPTQPRTPGDRKLKHHETPWWGRWFGWIPWVRKVMDARRVPSLQYYDIEGIRKYSHVFQPGEPVVITEKIHGSHAAYLKRNGKVYCFSRTMLREGDNNWTRMVQKYGLHRIPEGMILRGEIYGKGVQDLTYGADEVEFAVFDMQDYKTREYVDARQWCADTGVPHVPVLHDGPWSESLRVLADGLTGLGGHHVKEGIVIRGEGTVHGLGRKQLKLVSEGYLCR